MIAVNLLRPHGAVAEWRLGLFVLFRFALFSAVSIRLP